MPAPVIKSPVKPLKHIIGRNVMNFLLVGQLRGSLGSSDGCGTRMISVFFLAFKFEELIARVVSYVVRTCRSKDIQSISFTEPSVGSNSFKDRKVTISLKGV